jgi:hypothetical protein
VARAIMGDILRRFSFWNKPRTVGPSADFATGPLGPLAIAMGDFSPVAVCIINDTLASRKKFADRNHAMLFHLNVLIEGLKNSDAWEVQTISDALEAIVELGSKP